MRASHNPWRTLAIESFDSVMRHRFTIRDLLWSTLVVALAVGWWLDHHSMQARASSQVQQCVSIIPVVG